MSILTIKDIMFKTEIPRTKVPIEPTNNPALLNASGMAKNPPPMVDLIICIMASKFLYAAGERVQWRLQRVAGNRKQNTVR